MAPLEGPRGGEPCSEAGVADVAVVGGAFRKSGESLVECGGVETEAPPVCSVSGSNELEEDPSLLPSCPCTVNSCVCVWERGNNRAVWSIRSLLSFCRILQDFSFN